MNRLSPRLLVLVLGIAVIVGGGVAVRAVSQRSSAEDRTITAYWRGGGRDLLVEGRAVVMTGAEDTAEMGQCAPSVEVKSIRCDDLAGLVRDSARRLREVANRLEALEAPAGLAQEWATAQVRAWRDLADGWDGFAAIGEAGYNRAAYELHRGIVGRMRSQPEAEQAFVRLIVRVSPAYR